eukprot:4000553-Pyramimonas_sp.AAC.1
MLHETFENCCSLEERASGSGPAPLQTTRRNCAVPTLSLCLCPATVMHLHGGGVCRRHLVENP